MTSRPDQPDDRLAHVSDLVGIAHALLIEADRVATRIAELCDTDPAGDRISDAIYNTTDRAKALAILLGTEGSA